jgi:O-antigen/teichoic acid export membrane protein
MVDRDTITKSLFWKFLERCTAQLVTLIIGIVLARLLTPEDFGALSILLVFVYLSVILTEAGFSAAIIQKTNVDDRDYGTALVISLGIAVLLYIMLFVLSPFLASFYTYPGLDHTLKVISIVLFPNAISSIFKAKASREFLYKKLFYANLGASVISGLSGVFLAHCGFNLWALVMQQLLFGIITCVILKFQLKWWPYFSFSIERARTMFTFGWKIMVANIIDSLFGNFRTLLVGKAFDTNTLGYYSQARQYPSAISTNINTSIGTVMFPAMANVQDDIAKVKTITRRAIKTSTYLVFPVLLGFAAISDSFVVLILTEKWLPSVRLIKIICIAFLFEPIITINSQARNSIGQSGNHLRIVSFGKFIDFSILILTWQLFNSVFAMAIGESVSALIMALIGGVSSRKLIGYTMKEQVVDIIPNLSLAVIMFVVVNLILYIQLSPFWTLVTQVFIGCLVYFSLSIIFKNESFSYLKDYIKVKLKK